MNLNSNYPLHMALRVGFHVAAAWWLVTMGLAPQGLVVLLLCYTVSLLSITAGYHRYFAHRSFKTSRWFQFVLGLVGSCQLQGGPIAWASVHRHHHKHSDEQGDMHSPTHGLYWSHMGWLMHPRTYEVAFAEVKDLQRYRELVWLDRYNAVPVVLSFVALALAGAGWQFVHPGSIVTPWFVLFWGGVIRIVLLWHITWSVNSICHLWGSVAFETGEGSRNNLLIGLLAAGEGWHNNHHHAPSCARSGFGWQQPDLAYGVIRLLEGVGVLWDVRRALPEPRVGVDDRSSKDM